MDWTAEEDGNGSEEDENQNGWISLLQRRRSIGISTRLYHLQEDYYLMSVYMIIS